MKVLYVWDTAGVFSPVASWLNKANGHEAKILMNEKCDPFGQTSQLDCAIMVKSAKAFYKRLIRELLFFRPDVVHVSDGIKLFLIARLFAPRAKIVMTYHGSVRRMKSGKRHPEVNMAEKVTVATPDLCEFGEWMDRPIWDYFYDRGGRVKDTAVMFYTDYFFIDWREEAKMWTEANDIDLTIVDRTKGDFIFHKDLPEFFSKFEFFLDYKGFLINSNGSITVSVAAMEAKMCGCKIIHDSTLGEVKENITIISPKDYYDMYVGLKKPSWVSLPFRILKIIKGLFKWMIKKLDVKYENFVQHEERTV